jgi:hypothetical protein
LSILRIVRKNRRIAKTCHRKQSLARLAKQLILLQKLLFFLYEPLCTSSHGLKYDYPLSGLTTKTPLPLEDLKLKTFVKKEIFTFYETIIFGVSEMVKSASLL